MLLHEMCNNNNIRTVYQALAGNPFFLLYHAISVAQLRQHPL